MGTEASYSVCTLRLVPSSAQARRLDQALFAAGNLKRALVRHGLARLSDLRESSQWKEACALPTGLNSAGVVTDPAVRTIRNQALNETRQAYGLTNNAFIAKALELRRRSIWIGEHVPSSSANVLASEVWESFARHLFDRAGKPRAHSPWTCDTLPGRNRDEGRDEPSDEEVARYAEQGKTPPKARGPKWVGLSLRESDVGLTMRLSPCQDRARRLDVSVVISDTEREAYYLSQPDRWHSVRLVRRRVRGHYLYEAHLLTTLAPWRAPSLYRDAPATTVGIDLGVSTLAAVALHGDRVTGALLVKPTAEEKARAAAARAKLRRQQRAQERSRRATNPTAYGPDKQGRPGRGSLLPGHRLSTSRAHRERRNRIRDDYRRRAEERERQRNVLARRVVTELGTRGITEDVSSAQWKARWGTAVGSFAPGALLTKIDYEMRVAGGAGLTKVPTSLALTATCHCGARSTKSLAERTHVCATCNSTPVDRDLHAALLAGCVSTTGTISLDAVRARAVWDNGAEGPLRAASRALDITQHPSQQSRGVSSRDKLSRASGRSARSTSPRAPVAVGEKTEHARPVCVIGATSSG